MSLLLWALLGQFGIYYDYGSLKTCPDIEQHLSQLSQDGISNIWLTDIDSRDGYEFSKVCAKHSIKLFIRPNEITLNTPAVLNGDHATAIAEVLRNWAGPPPVWICGDELPTSSFPQAQKFYIEWKKQTNQPLSLVQHWGGLQYSSLGGICLDIYPFFRPGVTGYPTTPHQAFLSLCRQNYRLGNSHVMIQTFDNPDFVVTPAQISWQTWAAYMSGANIFAFCGPTVYDNQGLFDENWVATPKYQSFSSVTKILSSKQGLVPDPSIYCAVKGNPSAHVMGMTDGKQKYLLVLAGYESQVATTVEVGPDTVGLYDDSFTYNISWNGLGSFTLNIPPGTGIFLNVISDPTNTPTLIPFNLSSNNGLMTYKEGLNGKVWSAKNSSPWGTNYTTFDLGKTPSGLRVVKYNGWGEPKSSRGVKLYQSTGSSFTQLSQNDFNKSIPLTQRYLRTSVTWSGAADFNYGWLSEHTIYCWRYR